MAGILGLLMSGAGLIKDQYFNLTTLLLPGNGTNGAQNNTFLDSSTNNFTITRNGNTTQGTFSPFSQTGWGNYFDGSNDYLSISNQTALQLNGSQFTIEGWFYFTTSGVDNYIVIQSSGMTDSNVNWLVRVTSTNKLRVLLMTSGSTPVALDGSTTVTANSWHHFAATCDGTGAGSNVRSWLDGVYQGGTTVNPANINTNTASTQIGGWSFGSSYSPGYISNLRILKGTALYTGTANITVPTVPLTAITNTSLLTCQSNRFIDNSSNNFTITKNGDTSVVAFSPFNPTASWSAATNGGSGYFDGSGDVLTATNSTLQLNGTFTVDCFFYITNLSSNRGIWINGNNDSDRVQLIVLSTGVIEVYARTASTPSAPFPIQLTSSSGVIVANQWYQVTVTSDNSTAKLYVNGTEIVSGSVLSALPTVNDFNIGRARSQSVNRDMAGYISNVRVVKGSVVVPPAGGYSSPLTAIPDTALLLNFTNAGIYDATSKNDLETVGNAQISTSVSKFGGGSIAFDGTGDWLQLPASNIYAFGSGDYTVEAWVYFTSINNTTLQIIFMSGSTGGNSFYFHVDGNQISVGTSAAFISNQVATFTTDLWYHIAACRSGTTLRLFVNGTQAGSNATDTTNWTSSGNARIGANETGGQTVFGYIDDLRITKGYARYTANFTVPTAPFPVQ